MMLFYDFIDIVDVLEMAVSRRIPGVEVYGIGVFAGINLPIICYLIWSLC